MLYERALTHEWMLERGLEIPSAVLLPLGSYLLEVGASLGRGQGMRDQDDGGGNDGDDGDDDVIL